jgi:nitroimidazol reductase NimA-like FMN-containing flavoprotein (pyridoxamine 5'-phosphate oxidase superfamily)
MLIRDMTAEECRDQLVQSSFGNLGCARNDQPYVVPIYFAYEADRLYGFSTLGKKIEWMRLNPRVCVEVVEVISHFQWKSVIITGRYEELSDTADYSSKRVHAQSLLEQRYLWWQAAYAANQFRDNKDDPPLFYCIHIVDIVGRCAVPDSTESRVPL